MAERTVRTPAPMYMWAVVIIQRRSTWIHWHTIRRTRREAVDAFLEGYVEPYRTREANDRNKSWRVERVWVECFPSEARER